jgi:uncharacterized membrane protein
MAAAACASTASFVGISLPKVRNTAQRSLFGDLVLVAFLLVQCFDGVFTYVGVSVFGLGIEANPLVASLMTHLGHGPGLLSAKMMAAFLGICLHFREVHLAVAVLTGFYAAAALAPWAMILFF